MATDSLSRMFSALADPTRRDIVARLASGDATLSELAVGYEVSVQAVAKHLRVLEDAGMVTRRRDAQRRPAHLEADVLDLAAKWIERFQRLAEARYQRLDAVLAALPAAPPAAPPAALPAALPAAVPDDDPSGRPDRGGST